MNDIINSNYVIYDYITFTTKIHSHFAIIEYLGLQNVKFESLKGFYGYQERLYFDGISIHYNGKENMGVCVEMSGTGCRSFEAYGTGDYETLFSDILDNYDDNDSEKCQMRLTRVDVAYDDFTGIIDLPLLCRETQQINFVSRFKDWQVIFGNKGIGVNHGSTKSNVYIRFYDKRLEQKVEDKIPHWVRAEIQIRHENAIGFLKLPYKSVNKKYFDILNYYLRYIVPSNNVTNASMLPTAPYWLKFIESAESKTIFFKPAHSYNFGHLQGYVTNQLSGAIATYIDVVGVEQFLIDVNNSRKGKKLNPKYESIKAREHANCNNILEFLRSKGENV